MKTIILLILLSFVGALDPLWNGNGILRNPLQDTFPVPTGIPDLLFYIQRDLNANTVCYVPNLDKSGKLNARAPIDMFWLKSEENGERAPLNYVQRKFAYGIKVRNRGTEEYEVTLAACSKRLLYLRKDSAGKFRIYTRINNKSCTLNRVFIRIMGGTKLAPQIEYIELTGTELESGKVLAEKVQVS
ncbi:protein of unknown function [Dyadobacter soli]|uniref:DUF4833 domain-containing protein n=1 Tax=Dyadobacter soli TaxID=659014 RepID=A0A1G6VL99_9BACT|nr:DUF4833 domain-containing protein [Dyadobacter soli]SDD53626.1 protein of unknown function [Dyadobacter soli]